MSHGGGVAKVYFVLYLAVLLELLIMIVERDEAEEGLKKQNSESMKIVESILSQLYSGSGSESINTKPQDEITLPAEADMATIKEIFGTELKTSREYLIEVGVTDVTTAVKKQEGETSKDYDARVKKLLSLANVEELEYQIFYTPIQSADSIPAFQSDEYIRENGIDFENLKNKLSQISITYNSKTVDLLSIFERTKNSFAVGTNNYKLDNEIMKVFDLDVVEPYLRIEPVIPSQIFDSIVGPLVIYQVLEIIPESDNTNKSYQLTEIGKSLLRSLA